MISNFKASAPCAHGACGLRRTLADRGGHHRIDLDAYDYRWYRVGGLEYAIERDAAPVG